MNETIERFGYPATLVAEYPHWVVLLRPAQPTLGSLVLAAKSDATAFGDLPAEAHSGLAQVTRELETALRKAVQFEKLNYLMLMMVDPHVHFHVIPRYDGSRTWGGMEFVDGGWPKTPDLASAQKLTEEQIGALVGRLRDCWPQA